MKKYSFLLVFMASVLLESCTFYGNDLEKMGASVKQHFKYKDVEEGTVTNISYIKALSYDEIPEDEREEENEIYLCKVYVRGTWAYYNSQRIFNIDDTLDCYFNKSKTFIRIGNKEK
ncbi:hypothetical protein [Dysgonomonas sp. Marseille-P4361]|uniref:hypothetical protein n=1 Tax=Dysgonomonas sp. Marseille-P4361 TaxID=2161820 RepID=UPI000D560E5C|nr:hypothetical protein [Dysgonomonas sp. Marseille-P4361]